MKMQVRVKGTRPTYGTDDRGVTITHDEGCTCFVAECNRIVRICFNTNCHIVYERGQRRYMLQVSKRAFLRCDVFDK